jgi:hypothetical protein
VPQPFGFADVAQPLILLAGIMADHEHQTPEQRPVTRQPSDATRARREAKLRLAPYVAKLSDWHPQAARLLLEVDRAVGARHADLALVQAVETMIGDVTADQAGFDAITLELRSSRVDDLAKSFSRLLIDLQAARTRLLVSVDGQQK